MSTESREDRELKIRNTLNKIKLAKFKSMSVNRLKEIVLDHRMNKSIPDGSDNREYSMAMTILEEKGIQI